MANRNFSLIHVLIIFSVFINNLNVSNGGTETTNLCVEPPSNNVTPLVPVNPSTINPTTEPPPSPPYHTVPFNPYPIPPNTPTPTAPFYQSPIPVPPPSSPPNLNPINPPYEWNPPPACQKGSPINVKYQTESPTGELGIKFSYDTSIDEEGKMNVMIAYETESATVAKFFTEQFTPQLFQEFTQCNVIKWDIRPCSKSKLMQGELYCPQGEKQCEFDKIHACASTLYSVEPQKMGLFVICFFSQQNDAQTCASKYGMVYDDIWTCASGVQGAQDCDACYRHIHDKKKRKLYTPPPPYTGEPPVDPIGGCIQPPIGGGVDPIGGGGVVNPGISYPENNTNGSPGGVPTNQATTVNQTPPTNLAPSTHQATYDVVPTSSLQNPGPFYGGFKDGDLNVPPEKDPNLDAITDFKDAVCAKLKEGQLECNFCSC
ncbi:uncharacterized protein LOC135842482 [Planococcus citri]|uniref:uncharacterized protein LOC135842482 n=1 Tax=Planococcus citri TaxID=170843 RepID=UPI0031F7FFF9